jgi:peptidoglycan hydrolase CwlO-like protein
MTVLQIFGIVFGATGFWKLIEVLLQFRMQKRLKNAEINNLNTQANSLVVENYKLWTENMDRRIKELESKNSSLETTVGKQRERILKLESKNTEMNQTITKQRERINELESEILKYKN